LSIISEFIAKNLKYGSLSVNYQTKNIKNLSAQTETFDVESLKIGEVFTVMYDNPEPSPEKSGKV